MRRLYFSLTFVCFLFCQMATFAVSQAPSEKVTFIYIHGVYEVDPKVFDKEVVSLHKHFANKRLGNYVISPEYKKIYWGDMPLSETSYKLFSSGLMAINTENNVWKVKATTDPKISLLLNPINRMFLVGDMGSKSNAVFFRNFINNYVYQLVWVIADVVGHNTIFDKIESQIDSVDGKYVIVAHSLGSAISTKFIMERVMLNPGEKFYNPRVSNNFAGLITGGDVNNTFLAVKLARDLNGEKISENEKNFARYFADNGKFWISYNHRNDLFATKLPEQITSYKNIPNSGIVSVVNKEFPFEAFVDFFRVGDSNNNIFEAHQFMFSRPKDFAKGVLLAYSRDLMASNNSKSKIKKVIK